LERRGIKGVRDFVYLRLRGKIVFGVWMTEHSKTVSEKIAQKYEIRKTGKDTYNRDSFIGPADELVKAANKREERGFEKYAKALELLKNGARRAEEAGKEPQECTIYAAKARSYRIEMEKKKGYLGDLRPDKQKQFENNEQMFKDFETKCGYKAGQR
jgi:hypothetical protein